MNQPPASPPAAADVPAVLAALEGCSHPDPSIREPAERLIETWERQSEEAGYFSSLLAIIGGGDAVTNVVVPVVPGHFRLLAAILAKNAVPHVWRWSRGDEEAEEGDDNGSARPSTNGASPAIAAAPSSSSSPIMPACQTSTTSTSKRRLQTQQRTAERTAARATLPALLLSESDDRIALHLRLALANAALFDYPARWPTLLSDLASISESEHYAPNVRGRCAKAIRDVLKALRHRKLIVKGGMVGPGRGGIRSLMALQKMASDMAQERKRTQEAVAPAFGPLGAKTWERARNFVAGGPGWEIDGMLCGTYLKACGGELLPMVARHEGTATDIGTFLGPAALFLRETRTYFLLIPPSVSAMGAAAAESWLRLADRAHRAALNCASTACDCCPALYAPHFPACLRSVLDAMLELDRSTLAQIPVKRLVAQTRFVKSALSCRLYDPKAPKIGHGGMPFGMVRLGPGGQIMPLPQSLPPSANGGSSNGDDAATEEDPSITGAKHAISALLGPQYRPRLIETLVTKYLRLTPLELEEWAEDPEGRFQTDEAERTATGEPESPRNCGGIVLANMMSRERLGVGHDVLALAAAYQNAPPAYQNAPPDDAEDALLNREACYAALEVCRAGLDPAKFKFADWWRGELSGLLTATLTLEHPVAMRAMQARAIKSVHAFSRKIPPEDFGDAFRAVATLLGAADVVTALDAARCLNTLALLVVDDDKDTTAEDEGSIQVAAVREHSVPALGGAFTLANRVSSDECLKTALQLVSGLIEANGTTLTHCLPAVAEQLPPLWERAGDSVPIHSCLIAVLNHLIMKLGYPAVENGHVQRVLFPLLDYCTDISASQQRAETLLDDGLKLWLVTLVTSRLETMGDHLRGMLPRLEAVLRSGMEAQLSLQVLQFYSVLLGPGVVESVGEIVQGLLVRCMSCMHGDFTEGRGGGQGKKDAAASGEGESDAMAVEDTANEQQGSASNKTDVTAGAGGGTLREAVGALSFMEALLQLSPPVGYAICLPALSETVRTMLTKPLPVPLVESLFSVLGRVLWNRPSALDEILGNDDPEKAKKVCALVNTWLRLLSRPVFMAMLDKSAATALFMERKGAALSLCAVVCHGTPEIAALLGPDVIKFTEAIQRQEEKSKPDVDGLVEAACGTARKVVGDGPLGDAARRSADMLKADPLLRTSLGEALDNVQGAVERARAQQGASDAMIART